MTSDPRRSVKRWADEYASLLEAYSEHPTESVLREAASLGRSLFEGNVSPHEVVSAHTACTERLCERGAAGDLKFHRAAGALLSELVKVYSRAYQDQQEHSERLLSARVISATFNREQGAIVASVELTSQAGRAALANLEL